VGQASLAVRLPDFASSLDDPAVRAGCQLTSSWLYGHNIMTIENPMKQIPAGEFKAQCLAIMDHIYRTGEPLIVTKHGKPVVKLVPAERQAEDIFDYMAGKAKAVGDIVRPVTPREDWKYK
jgi:prevent-host-death family protein